MPVAGRLVYSQSDIVRNPPRLPIPMSSGTLNWSVGFEQFPSATLQYESIAQSDIGQFESAYNFRKPLRKIYINLYGVDLQVESYSYTRTGTVWRGRVLINIYTVSVGFKSRWEDGINTKIKVFKLVSPGTKKISVTAIARAAKVPYSGESFDIPIPVNADKDFAVSLQDVILPYARILGCYVSYETGVKLVKVGGGGSWNLSDREVVTDGSNTLQEEVGYNKAELTWTDTTAQDDVPSPPGQLFTVKEPVIDVLIEEDDDVELPPPNSKVLRTLDSNADISGEKKQRKESTLVNGIVVSEKLSIFGFEYTAENIRTVNDLIFSDEPGNFWRVVEYQKTEYIYKLISGLTLNIKAKDPDPQFANTSLSGFVYLIVHPDYESFATVSPVGGSTSFAMNTLYLTGTLTTGWRRFRFKKETEGFETFFDDDLDYPLYNFIKIPSVSEVAYNLITTRSLYGGETATPFSVEWKSYLELEERIREKVDSLSQQSSNGKVGILFPDSNYVEPMTILTETRKNSSFAFTPDPESTPDAPLVPLMTGEDSFYKTQRTIINPNRYKEKISEFSTQNAGFSDLAEKVSFKDFLGRPPEASTRKTEWEKTDKEANERLGLGTNPKKKRYIITSDNSKFIEEGDTKSYPQATTQAQAIAAAKTELEIAGISQDQSQRTVFSYYPNMKSGDRVQVGLDRFQGFGTWVIVSANFSLKFSGTSGKYNLRPICQAQPTSLTLGLHRDRRITIKEESLNIPADGQTDTDPELITSGGETQTLGKILINSPNRRQF